MFGKKEVGKITFYYNSDGLFNDVSLMSAYMTKNLANEGGSLMDEFSISDDERDIYDVCVRQTLPNIYETIMKITPRDVDNAFEDEIEVETDESPDSEGIGLKRVAGKYIELTLNDNDSYNKNVLNLVDATLLNCLKYGILAEFYSICVNADLYRIAQDKFTSNLFQLKKRLFQLKKKTISPQLS
jgi:hypothetical protein